MGVENAVYPSPDQIERLMGLEDDGPVSMLNLIKFKDKAEYADGRETDLTGAQAYGLYAADMKPFVEKHGGRFLVQGAVEALMIGKVGGGGGGDWDVVAIVEYPSKKAFIETTGAPEVQAFGVHRAAGLEGQLLVATKIGPVLA